MKRIYVGAGAMLLAGAAACQSGPPGPPGGMPPGGMPPGGVMLVDAKIARPVAILFTGFDINGDLMLSKQELETAIPMEFARADADASGVLTGFELVDWSTLMLGFKEAQPDLRAMDTDMTYTVTSAEFAIALRREFDLLDIDKNGVLLRLEMLMDAPRAPQMMGPDGGPPRRPPAGGRGGRGPGGGGPGQGGPPGGGGSPPF